MIERLVMFGASGDLAGRFLLPALGALHAAGELPDGFEVVGAARQDWDDAGFQRYAAKRLDRYATDVPASARAALVRSLRYRSVDVGDATSVAAALGSEKPIVAYLALPPASFPSAVNSLAAAGFPPGSRIALEKPFGESLEDAASLNGLLADALGDAGEQAVFRVDHVLGMATVQNILGLRFANRVLEPVWNSAHIDQVELLWEETLALEGRAGYYDTAGALKDVMQNHLLQVLCLIAMEPHAPGSKALRDRKAEVLRSVRPLRPEEMASRTRRARYGAGRLSPAGETAGRSVPAYADEDGVDPERETETFAEFALEIDNIRWSGTCFLLRAGKALAQRRKEVIVRFRPTSHCPLGDGGHDEPTPNELRIGIDGPVDITLHLSGSVSGPSPHNVPLVLEGPPLASDLPPYGRVLHEVLSGGSSLSVRDDEAELAWRVVAPILDAWAEGRVSLEEYPAGSAGP